MNKTNLLMKTLLLCLCILGSVSAWADNDYANPATKTYGDITFLDVANTDANRSDTDGNDYLTYGIYYVAKTKGITSWYNSSDGSPASNHETTGYSIENAANYGFYPVSSTAGDVNYGGTKCNLNRIRYFYVTGATSVAGIARDGGTSSSKYTQLTVQTVAEDGTLGAASNYGNFGSTSAGYMVDGGALDPTKYYKISFGSPSSSNSYFYQVRFGKSLSIDAPYITTQPVSGTYQKDATSKTLSVEATPSSGLCSYQWYSCDNGDIEDNPQSLGSGNNAQTATYTIPTGTAGTYYYFCRISDEGSNTTDSEVVTVVVADRAAKQTWDFTTISSEDVQYNSDSYYSSAFYTYKGNSIYSHSFNAATYSTVVDNFGNDLLNGIQVYRAAGNANVYVYCDATNNRYGINLQGANEKPGLWRIPVEKGKSYKVTYTSNSNSTTLGYIVGGDVTPIDGVTNREATITTGFSDTDDFTVTATADGYMTLTNRGTNANNCTLVKVEELVTLSGEWSTASDEFYQGDTAPDAPTFSVTASDDSSITLGTDYEVVYSLKEGSTEGIVTYTAAGGISAISNATAGTATIVATVTSDSYLVPTSTYEYTVTVTAKTPTIALDEDAVTLNSTPGKRRAGTEATATVTLTGIFLTDGEYNVTTSTTGLSISPTSFTVEDGAVSEEFTLTYAPGDVAVDEDEEVITFSDGTTSTDLTVTYSSIAASTLQSVSEATTWDWTTMTSSSNVQLKDDGTTTPAKAHTYDVVAADFDGEAYDLNANWPNTFPAEKIAFYQSEWPVRYNNGNPYYQGMTVKIATTVPGTIQVWYSNTGTKDVARFLNINGTEYGDEDGNGSKNSTIINTAAIPVSAGDITITGREGENNNYVHIQKIVFTPVTSVSGTISASGWNTFSSNYALDLSTITGGTAYVATSATDGKVTMTSTDAIIDADEGLMIKGTAGDTFTINTTAEDATLTGTNLLVGLPNGGEAPVGSYVFGWPTSDATDYGFYYVNESAATLDAGKAYLDAGGSFGARLSFFFDDETTGISNVEGSKLNVEGYYNLAGQRVAQPAKGLYIVNGKKVVVK